MKHSSPATSPYVVIAVTLTVLFWTAGFSYASDEPDIVSKTANKNQTFQVDAIQRSLMVGEFGIGQIEVTPLSRRNELKAEGVTDEQGIQGDGQTTAGNNKPSGGTEIPTGDRSNDPMLPKYIRDAYNRIDTPTKKTIPKKGQELTDNSTDGNDEPLTPVTLPFARTDLPKAKLVQEQLMMGELEEAELMTATYIDEEPENPTNYWLSGWVKNKNGKREEALEVVSRGRKIAPKHAGLQELEKLFRRKASDMAQKEVDRRKNSLLGTLHQEDAAGDLGPGFTLDERNFRGVGTEPGVKMAGMVNPAMMGRGHYQQPAPQSTHPKSAISRRGVAATKAGLKAMQRGNAKAAIQKLTEAIRRDPKNPAAWRLRAMAFQQADMHKQAVNDANRALQIDGSDHWAYLVRAKALTDLEQIEAAQVDIMAALELKPQSADAYATRARLWHKTKDHDKELDDYRTAANLDPAFQNFFRQAMRETERISAGTDAPVKHRRATKNLIYGAFALLGLGLVGAAFFRRRGLTSVVTKTNNGIAGFDIVRKLGQGGMGEVWEATDRALQRRVAIKKLVPEIAGVPRERQRFLKEARTVAALKHPGIIEIHQVVENGDDLFLVFEHVDGVALDSVLADKQRLSLPESLEVLRQTAEALDFAHGRGVIHQDLKPANIMVEGETVKVMDFGIARRVAETMGAVTRMEVVGTPSYMAPEQAHGEASPETDVYALGATLYEMLSGRRPFTGMMGDFSKMEKAYAPLSRSVPELPETIDAVIDCALDPDPKKRFHSGREFFEALRAVSETQTPHI